MGAELLPPLSQGAIAACERKFAVKFPESLLDLLRSQNGGFLENTDFRFAGKEHGVREIFGIQERESFHAIRLYSKIVCDADYPPEIRNAFRSKAGDPSRLLLFAINDYEEYALDFTKLNAAGEPTVLRVHMNEDSVRCKRVADSFEEFLKCQYFGDKDPAVVLADADDYALLAEGGYVGHHKVTKGVITTTWKICSAGDRFIVFATEDWGFGATLSRSEFKKKSLCFRGKLSDDEIKEMGPELTALVRGAVEGKPIGKEDIFVRPRGYWLRLETDPNGKERVKNQMSEPYEGRWKNSFAEILGVSVHSADKAALEEAMSAVLESL